MRHPFLRALLPAILVVVAGRELQEVEITAAPTMYPVKCNEVPTDRKVKFPNTTVGYSPTWYENKTVAPSPATSTGSPVAASGPPAGTGGGPGLPTTGAPSSVPVATTDDGGLRVNTEPPTGVPLTGAPTDSPVAAPTGGPTGAPTDAPTGGPTSAPTVAPTGGPTSAPTDAPTGGPTSAPTDAPTGGPTSAPTDAPTAGPTDAPTDAPTGGPTSAPTDAPTAGPTSAPTNAPTSGPTSAPTDVPTAGPTSAPTDAPTDGPTSAPTAGPTTAPSSKPTAGPTSKPSSKPTTAPTTKPTSKPSSKPTSTPTKAPTKKPTAKPTSTPTKAPTKKPTATPTKAPTKVPTAKPTTKMDCPVATLDFEGLSAGTYVSTQFQKKYGVTISATASRGGIVANGPRVFDSANQNGGDTKLMSPNAKCGGQGSGNGGLPTSAYSNCVPLDNILLVQANGTDSVRPNYDRSYIIFQFAEPVNLVAATFLECTAEKPSGYELIRVGQPQLNVTIPSGGTTNNANGKTRTVFGDAGKGVTTLRVRVERTGAIASLEYTWCLPQTAPTAAPTIDSSVCPRKLVDFATLKPNTYVRNELMKQYQLELTAILSNGGYSPGGRVMVMDSTKPSKTDPDLGTPNEAFGGPGKGAGGANGTKWQNSKKLGNIIFVQQNNTADADNLEGAKSTLIFRFNGTATMHSFTLLDADGTTAIQTMLYLQAGGTKYIYTAPSGDNGVMKVNVETVDVTEMRVVLPNGGAVADIEFTSCALIETPAPTYSPQCPDVDLDFNLLMPGSYVGDQLWGEYGIKFQTYSVGGGYRPNSTARVFDSSNPGNSTFGSPDIGSPNQSCNGTGVGLGGHFSSRYANCGIGQGNALIIQSDSKNPVPQYYAKGANTFKIFFKVPVYLESITIIVGHNCKQMKFTAIQDPYAVTYSYGPLDITENGVFTQTIGLQNVIQLTVDMPFGGAISDIKYTWCPFDSKAPTQAPVRAGLPTVAPTKKPVALAVPAPSMMPIEYRTDCDMTILDFEGMPRGQYITNNFLLSHGVTISAKAWNGGYVPNNAARIFDTSNPGEVGVGDPDLGSPNDSCGGPGIGSGGARGSAFENCVPLGNVLTVQSTLKATPDDHENGFEITFSFIYPVYLESAQIMDNDGCNCDPIRFTLYLADGSKVVKTGASATGNNGVAWVYLATERVVRVGVYFPTSGAISSLNYIMCLPELLKSTLLPNAPQP